MKYLESDSRPWGKYFVLDEGSGFKVKRIEVKPGKRLSLQSHKHRQEQWVVVQGQALVTLAQSQFKLESGDTIKIPFETKHRIENIGSKKLIFIEVQTGTYLGEDDIIRYEDDFNRV